MVEMVDTVMACGYSNLLIKGQILGVDTPGYHVSPHVWYGTACLLIMNSIGSVSCSVEWGVAWCFP
jgi:hypothetical protein